MQNNDKGPEKAKRDDPMSDEDVIELIDSVNADGEGGYDELPEDGGDFIELTELADVPSTQDPTAAAPTDEQVEQALRRVVKELYADKIERLLYEVVEETVTREIDKIKRLLLDVGADSKS